MPAQEMSPLWRFWWRYALQSYGLSSLLRGPTRAGVQEAKLLRRVGVKEAHSARADGQDEALDLLLGLTYPLAEV